MVASPVLVDVEDEIVCPAALHVGAKLRFEDVIIAASPPLMFAWAPAVQVGVLVQPALVLGPRYRVSLI